LTVLFESFNFPEFLLVIAFMIFNPTTIMELAIYLLVSIYHYTLTQPNTGVLASFKLFGIVSSVSLEKNARSSNLGSCLEMSKTLEISN